MEEGCDMNNAGVWQISESQGPLFYSCNDKASDRLTRRFEQIVHNFELLFCSMDVSQTLFAIFLSKLFSILCYYKLLLGFFELLFCFNEVGKEHIPIHDVMTIYKGAQADGKQ